MAAILLEKPECCIFDYLSIVMAAAIRMPAGRRCGSLVPLMCGMDASGIGTMERVGLAGFRRRLKPSLDPAGINEASPAGGAGSLIPFRDEGEPNRLLAHRVVGAFALAEGRF